MRINRCPICKEKAFIRLGQIFVEESHITCQNCGVVLNHSIPHLLALNFAALVVLVWGKGFLRDMDEYLAYLSIGLLFVFWLSAIVPITPMKEVSPKNYELDSPKKSGGNNTFYWYQSPIIWLGIPTVMVVLYDLFT